MRYAAANSIFSIKVSSNIPLFLRLPESPWYSNNTRGQEIDIGMAADVGSLARFPKVVGNESFTREMAFTGRDFTAAEALQVGFVSKVVEGGREGVLGTRLSLSRLLVITAMCRNRYWRKIANANAGLND